MCIKPVPSIFALNLNEVRKKGKNQTQKNIIHLKYINKCFVPFYNLSKLTEILDSIGTTL